MILGELNMLTSLMFRGMKRGEEPEYFKDVTENRARVGDCWCCEKDENERIQIEQIKTMGPVNYLNLDPQTLGPIIL